jgi:hypothetical protein
LLPTCKRNPVALGLAVEAVVVEVVAVQVDLDG